MVGLFMRMSRVSMIRGRRLQCKTAKMVVFFVNMFLNLFLGVSCYKVLEDGAVRGRQVICKPVRYIGSSHANVRVIFGNTFPYKTFKNINTFNDFNRLFQ